MVKRDQQQRQADDAERMRAFGVWLESQIYERYSSLQEFARAAGLAYNSVKTLVEGGSKKPGEPWVVANPSDATLRKVSNAIDQPEAVVFERAGGNFRARNPHRWQREGDPWASGTRGSTAERIAALEAELQRVRERNARTEQILRDAGIPIPDNGGDQEPAPPVRRRRDSG